METQMPTLPWRWQRLEAADIACGVGILSAFSQMVYADSLHDLKTAVDVAVILIGLGFIIVDLSFPGALAAIFGFVMIWHFPGPYAFTACAWILAGIALGYVAARVIRYAAKPW
jgi:hypothetical protein